MKNLYFTIVFILIADSPFAFEFEGYRSGMSKEDVINKAEKMADIVEHEGATVVNYRDGSYKSFNFCEGKLVSMAQGQVPNIHQLAILVEDHNKRYGQPYSIKSNSSPVADGRKQEMGFWWKSGDDYINIFYMKLDAYNEGSLSTSRQVKNSCFKVPR